MAAREIVRHRRFWGIAIARFLAEPAWAELKERYAGRMDFEWEIALMDAAPKWGWNGSGG